MISRKKYKRVTLEDIMRKLEVMETNYNQLLDKFDKVAALNDKFNNNTEEIMVEIKDREHRARNIIIYNLDESAHTDLEKRITHDTGEVGSMMELAGIRAEQIVKVVRMGKKVTRARPVKVVFSSQDLVGEIWKNKSTILNNYSRKISIQDDRMEMQRTYYRKIREELDQRKQAGE
ncbi:hypothetical protein HHI36_009609, partial [Cryptolaemus montrouzieri]